MFFAFAQSATRTDASHRSALRLVNGLNRCLNNRNGNNPCSIRWAIA
jgi:hypothetical protein